MATGPRRRRPRTRLPWGRSLEGWLLLALVVLVGCLAGCTPGRAGLQVPASGWKPRLVIMMVLDTCRADHLGCYGYPRLTSPCIDRLASEGVLFEQAFSQSNESLFSAASLLTSLYPQRVAPLDYDAFYLQPRDVTWPVRLQAAGWSTAAFVAGGHWSRAFGFGAGFDVYDDHADFGSFYDTWPQARQWLAGLDRSRPAFLLLHGYDVHTPYKKPLGFDHLFDPGYKGVADDITALPEAIENIYDGAYFTGLPTRASVRTGARGTQLIDPSMFATLQRAEQEHAPAVRLSKGDLAHLVAHYDGGIAYADTYVGLLRAELQARGLDKDTLLVLLGDHGEDLAEHGFFNHRASLHDGSLHVPLVLWGPGGLPRGLRVSQIAQLVDVFPTLFELAGVELPRSTRLEAREQGKGASLPPRDEAIDGASLLPLVRGAAAPGQAQQVAAGRPGGAPERLAYAEGTLAAATVRSSAARLVASGRRVAGRLDPRSLRFEGAQVQGGVETRTPAPAAELARLRSSLLDWMEAARPPSLAVRLPLPGAPPGAQPSSKPLPAGQNTGDAGR